ncbi:MAG: GIY-YIG nuclease family protein [Desulfocapsa sp.]|uniref:GIY-YIG nuclease family protein n=1 Tax=Desulfotalea psychrophila TaxID=84980 RepID=A0ABS3ATA7_9BACT|nr:GIY-YIG nuclease family protein [Desulfocapsa sp.]MBN4052913.1 GIY-YIG nuclease family protein [bacterium AH-315-K15]MBN4067988.1 GIY-YIG nuclease family protein [Desulfotalea psychrophila]
MEINILSAPPTSWFVYLLRCCDNSIYTGITTNLDQRIHEHNHSEKGAKYTRGRRPVTLLYHEKMTSRTEASQREYQIKQMKKSEKEQLVKDSRTPVI